MKIKPNDKVLVIAKYCRTNQIGIIKSIDSYECIVMFEDSKEEKIATSELATMQSLYEQIIEETEKIGQLRTYVALLTSENL